MDGYDTALIGTLFGFPAFQQRFGVPVPGSPGTFQITAKWQDALGLASPLGNIVGIFVNGILTERFGHKKTLLGFIIWLTACIFIAFFAPSVQVLFVGELLCGLSWGCFTTLAPAYASEVTPVALRGYLETWVVLCWGIGQMVSYGVLDGLVGNVTQWAWRIPFAVQWAWIVIALPFIIFAPESPVCIALLAVFP
jgi:SP family general alpha glucoside:H+ symporter-like MFS transporter